MRLAIRRIFSRSFRQRLASAMLLVVYVVTAAGIPLPTGSVQTGGELYPCAEHACGCASAEQCWRSCCCHSLAERFAWAQEHKVRPPEYAIAAARRAGLDLAWLGEPAMILGHRPATCCSAKTTLTVSTCCQKIIVQCDSAPGHAGCCGEPHNQAPRGKAANQVIGWRTLECQGHSADWLFAAPPLVDASYATTHELPLIGWLGPALSEHADPLADLPAIPPPEAA
jgi:hypothetical protein